jgi:hypothetical protein
MERDGEEGKNILEDEVVGISWWGSKHNDYGDEPVLKEAHEGCVAGFVAGPEAGEWEDTFTADFLNHWPCCQYVYLCVHKGV